MVQKHIESAGESRYCRSGHADRGEPGRRLPISCLRRPERRCWHIPSRISARCSLQNYWSRGGRHYLQRPIGRVATSMFPEQHAVGLCLIAVIGFPKRRATQATHWSRSRSIIWTYSRGPAPQGRRNPRSFLELEELYGFHQAAFHCHCHRDRRPQRTPRSYVTAS